MSPSALVIGGTGPTGPGVVSGLLERGFEVTIGQHEVELPTEVPHIYTDPHWRTDPHWPDTLVAGLAGESCRAPSRAVLRSPYTGLSRSSARSWGAPAGHGR